MKHGMLISPPAKKLLTDGSQNLNGIIADLTRFAETQSSATAKYRVATILNSAKKVVKELDKLIGEVSV